MICFRLQTVVMCLFCHFLTCQQPLTQLTIISYLQSYVALLAVLAWFLDWFIPYLSCRIQSVSVGHESTPAVLKFGVPQGSVLGPLLFILYTHPLSTVICQSGLSYHFFADDTQLHKSGVPSDFPVLACCLKDCIEDVAEWMGESKL